MFSKTIDKILERTKRALHASMQGLKSCLAFTVETGDEFADGWLPTLDMKLSITSDNKINIHSLKSPHAVSYVCSPMLL